ncbi:MAG: anti-sigma factor family protein [Pleurocapsa sp.]
MTSNFDDLRNCSSELDYFELLSAYIDGELTPAERNCVAEWLDTKPEIKTTYLQLLKLQTQMQKIPTPPRVSVKAVSTEVFQQLDRDRWKKRCCIWGGGAIAATLLATLSGIVPGVNSPGLRLAQSTPETFAQPVMVAVAVNKPAVRIPKTAVSPPQNDLTE